MIRVLWIVGSFPELRMVWNITRLLSEQGFEFTFAGSTETTNHKLSSYGCAMVDTSELLELEQPLLGVPESEFAALDARYPDPGFEALHRGDPYLRMVDRARGREHVLRCLQFWERHFSEHRYDWVLHLPTGTAIERAADPVARSFGSRPGIVCSAPRRDMFTVLDVNEEWAWSGFFDRLRERPPQNDRPSVEEREKVHEVRDAVLSSMSRNKPRTISIRRLFKVHKQALRMLSGPRTTRYFWTKAEAQVARNFLRWRLSRRRIGYVDRPPANRPYVYFPWHALDDANIMARYPYYEDQMGLSRLIAQSLPTGYDLLIKEHPYSLGFERPQVLRDLGRVHNIRLVDPMVGNSDLLQNASAILTVGGTSGWEGLLLKKPVVTLAGSFYAYSDLVYRVGGPAELAPQLRRALTEGAQQYELRTDEWYSFLYHSVSSALDGNFFSYKASFGGAWPKGKGNATVAECAESLRRVLTRVGTVQTV